MSKALYHNIGGLRFWSEDEIERRDAFAARMASVVRRTLRDANPAFGMERVEGPILTPQDFISAAYSEDDVFVTQIKKAGQPLALRAETTASSYAALRAMNVKLPFCVWQAGKSFRVEANDGASAAKMRFNEFWQLEFQVAFRSDTKADYRMLLVSVAHAEIGRATGLLTRVVPSDRLPAYSRVTDDIEVQLTSGAWREIASCSLRTDYADGVLVAEIAIGLDRIVAAQNENY